MKYSIGFLSLILLLGLAGCQSGNGEDVAVDSRVPVKVVRIKKELWVKPINTSGMLASSEQSRLSFKIGGIIDAIHVKEGDEVQAGQVMASLKLDEIEAQVVQARSGFEKAQRDFQRAQNLYADSVATLEQIQDAKTGLAVAEAQKKIAEFNLKHARIIAPESGTILKQFAEQNELIGAGHPAFLFASGRKNWVLKAGVTDRDVVQLAIGDSATLRFDAYPTDRFKATVQEIAGAPDPMSGTYEIALALAMTEKPLYTGFLGAATIYPAKQEEAYCIPIRALVDANQRTGVVYSVDDSLAYRHEVSIRYMNDACVAVDGDLDEVMFLVTEGAPYLKQGTAIRMTGEDD